MIMHSLKFIGLVKAIGSAGLKWLPPAVILAMLLALSIPIPALAADPPHKSGYEDVSDLGEGPSDITDVLESDDRDKETLLGSPATEKLLSPWFAAKEALNDKIGLQFGLSWTGLYQKATETTGTEDDAAAGRFLMEGTWTAIGRESQNRGILGFRLQDRHRIGTDLTPAALGPATGSAWTSGYGFNEFSFSLTDLWWEQHLLQGSLSIRIGKLLPFNIFDPFSLKSPLAGFQNAAFNGTPAMALPSFGLGASGKVRLAETVELILGFSDANGKPTTSGFDTFFDEHDYFSAGELRWAPTFGAMAGKTNLTLWHTDAREIAATPEGWGITFSSELKTGGLAPFLRYGWSDGGATVLDHLISGGMGWHGLFGQANDLMGIGLSWGKPHNRELDDQTAAETFYRLHLFQFLALTPSVQAVINPARHPDEDLIFIFGIRARFAF